MCFQDYLGGLGHVRHEIFKIRMLRLAENEFHIFALLFFLTLTFLSLFLPASNFPDISRFSRSLDTLRTSRNLLRGLFEMERAWNIVFDPLVNTLNFAWSEYEIKFWP